jgi:hypothetical protein
MLIVFKAARNPMPPAKAMPRFQTSDSVFEAVFRNADGDSWRIRQDGLVWKESPANDAGR